MSGYTHNQSISTIDRGHAHTQEGPIAWVGLALQHRKVINAIRFVMTSNSRGHIQFRDKDKDHRKMNAAYKPQITSKDLSDRITEHIQRLAEATDAALGSEEMIKYLDTFARFHRYSPNNVWLILMSKPDATMVAGYSKWRKMGRYVKKGERGIPILAPLFKANNNEDGEEKEDLVGFRVVYVFDASQTDGEPLPEPPNWKSPEQNATLTERLITFAQSKGIQVSVKQLAGETQGVSTGGAIVLSKEAGTKTLIHEIAHEMLHRGDDRPYGHTIREMEAESVAYVVGKHFVLEDLASPNYVALHGAEAGMILAYIERIRSTSVEIINALEEEKDMEN